MTELQKYNDNEYRVYRTDKPGEWGVMLARFIRQEDNRKLFKVRWNAYPMTVEEAKEVVELLEKGESQ